jgi:YbgC/YbaW family acyl-CoA thioester hydrolase
MSAPFRTTRLIEFADTDMAGIVHFTAFFRWMEAAEHAFLRSRGLSVILEWQGEHLSFPRVSAACDYLRPVRFENVLDVEVRLARLGGKSLSYEIDFFHADQPVARGKLTTVCCRVTPGRQGLESVDVPEGIRKRLLSPSPS